MNTPVLVIGNKNYSSWSLRAWLALRKAGAKFQERRLPLDTPEFSHAITRLSPTGRVPALWEGDTCVWDSLAIAEYANERWAAGALWPAAAADRAVARSVSAEMHSGFHALRAAMPMNCRAVARTVAIDHAVRADVDRILSIWQRYRERYGALGPWLFGEFSIADAMFAPVAMRFRSYRVPLPDQPRCYVDTLLADDDIAEWIAAGRQESEVIAAEETGAGIPHHD